jgi:hypothetical protein
MKSNVTSRHATRREGASKEAPSRTAKTPRFDQSPWPNHARAPTKQPNIEFVHRSPTSRLRNQIDMHTNAM